ncbi:MAG: nuclease A inhibitor family protein [Xenococcaceae cyanobacterium]
MKPETEQAYGTLELLVDKLSFDLPGHENGGYIYPLVWDETAQGEFNIFNLCQLKNWLKLTDADAVIKSWQQLEYAKCFNDFSLNPEQIKTWEDNIKSLWQIINHHLDNLESYIFNIGFYDKSPNIIIGHTKDKDWIGIAQTIYVESNIPQEIIARSPINKTITTKTLGENTLSLDLKLKAITSKLGTIAMSGDFGGGYCYSYTHKIIYGIGATKELALENTLQKSGMLEINNFKGLYRDRQYLDNWFCDSDNTKIYQKYNRINQFMEQTFSEVIMYRLSSWTDENIYIIGQTNNSDRVGIYLKSSFVYNP